MTRRTFALLLAAIIALPSSAFAVDGKKASYIGGTAGLKEGEEGTFSTQSETALQYEAGKKGGALSVPYRDIVSLEYGQKSGRRVAVAVLVSPLALFSKKRNHFLTVGYKDASGTEQAAVFELGKDIVRTTLKVLEVRSGKAVEYEDDEARKSGLGGK